MHTKGEPDIDSPTDAVDGQNLVTKRGFAALPKGKHRELSSKGGSKKVPKGTAMLSPEDRTTRARNAANALWEKRKREKQENIDSSK